MSNSVEAAKQTNDREYDCVFVDFDGTLINTFPIWHAVHMEVCRRLGIPQSALSDITFDRWRCEFSDTSMRNIALNIINRFDMDVSVGEFMKKKSSVWCDYVNGKIMISELGDKTFDDHVVSSVLDEVVGFVRAEIPCYVVTRNYGSAVVPALGHIGLLDKLSGVISHSNMLEMRTETDVDEEKTDTYWRIMGELNVRPERCLVFEDSVKNIEEAKELGMKAKHVNAEDDD